MVPILFKHIKCAEECAIHNGWGPDYCIPYALVWCKMAFFKRVWHKLKVLPHLNPSKFKEPLIRAFKSRIVWDYTKSEFGDKRGQSWKFKKSQTQWTKLSGKNTQYVAICQKWSFPGIWNQEIPGKWWFKHSEWKTKLSDQHWVGKIPNMLQFVKNGNFQRISRFSGIWNLEIWKFWKSQKIQKYIL